MTATQGRIDAASGFDQEAIDSLVASFAGDLIWPGDQHYDDARSIWNGMIDKRPMLIARCAGVSDVILAVNFARESNLPPAIRAGGHNVAGHAISDGGITIDLSRMRAVHVDPEQRVAYVEGGATWADFEREASVFGLSTTGGVISSTGVAGLTLGGGIGWLVGKHGMSIDNLLAVQLVTQDGSVVRASAESHPDLFWALRGGGGNFGVATLFEFRLHPVSEILGGIIAWPAEEGPAILDFYSEFTRRNPEEMTVYIEYGTDPESGERLIAAGICHSGDRDEGLRAVEELRAFRTPVFDMVGPMPYREMQVLFDEQFPHGARYYWKGMLLSELGPGALEVFNRYSREPEMENATVTIEHYRGVMNRIAPEATAFPHRDAQYQVVIVGMWHTEDDDERGRRWVRALSKDLEPWSMNARFLNFNALDASERHAAVRAGYGVNYDRLVQVKRQYDPENFFRANNNIEP